MTQKILHRQKVVKTALKDEQNDKQSSFLSVKKKKDINAEEKCKTEGESLQEKSEERRSK